MAIIETNLEAVLMRNKMESKDTLTTKGDLYVGTGTTTKVVTTGGNVYVPKTDKITIPANKTHNYPLVTSSTSASGWGFGEASHIADEAITAAKLSTRIVPNGSYTASSNGATLTLIQEQSGENKGQIYFTLDCSELQHAQYATYPTGADITKGTIEARLTKAEQCTKYTLDTANADPSIKDYITSTEMYNNGPLVAGSVNINIPSGSYIQVPGLETVTFLLGEIDSLIQPLYNSSKELHYCKIAVDISDISSTRTQAVGEILIEGTYNHANLYLSLYTSNPTAIYLNGQIRIVFWYTRSTAIPQ